MKDRKMDKDFIAAIRAAQTRARETGARPAHPEALIAHMSHAAMKCGALGCNLMEATA